MIYVFDTNSLINLKYYYPERFPTLWSEMEKRVETGCIMSTREVYKELEQYNDVDFTLDWAKVHKKMFITPSEEETVFVREILAVKAFQNLIGEKNILRGKPVADPFVIAAAKIYNGTVVTEEKEKPNSAKIPNVCEHFNIPCMNFKGFMEKMNWKY